MNELTFGAPIAVHPEADPFDDVRWAASTPGVTAAWMIDHLQGWFPRGVTDCMLEDPHRIIDPLAFLSSVAMGANDIDLGVAVTDPVRRTAVALGHTASTISWLNGRRFKLGMGVGDPGQLRPFGLHEGRERTGRLHYMKPALAQLDALRQRGEAPSEADLPMARRTGYDLYIAAHGPRMLELTAQFGDGWIPTSLSPSDYQVKLTTLRNHAEKLGRDPASIKPLLFVWSALADTGRESRQLLRHPSVRAVALYRGKTAFETAGAVYPLQHSYVPQEISPRVAPEMLRQIPDSLVEAAVMHGSPQDVREQLDDYRRAGCEHVIMYDIGRFVEMDGTSSFRAAFLQLLAA